MPFLLLLLFFLAIQVMMINGKCDEGWTQVDYHCYKLVHERNITQQKAVDLCDDEGGLLATIRHKKDYKTLIGILDELSLEQRGFYYWIGLLIHRRSDGDKVLSMSFLSGLSAHFVDPRNNDHGEDCTIPWGDAAHDPKEPNNLVEPEHCVSLSIDLNDQSYTPGLMDNHCDRKELVGGFFCEKTGH